MIDKPGIYCLQIHTGSFMVTVLGGPELQNAFNSWRDGAYSAANRFTVEGMEDSAERSPLLVSLDPGVIQAVILTQR